MRFDYLHSPRPVFVTRLLEIRVPERLHNALYALLAAMVIIGGAWGIESYRLQQALRIEASYQQRFDVSQRALAKTNLYYGRVQSLVKLDESVQAIIRSGDDDARTLAEIANDLPEHSWLTGISHDATGLALEGRADNLNVLSRVVKGLMQTRGLRNPTLLKASAEKDTGQDSVMKYSIHIDGTSP